MAFRTQKISQMTPKGADLEATDLIEVSTIESGSYVTRSITGQELIDAIPLPPTGLTVGTTPISSGTIGRVLFQGTGNVLQQSSSLFWDATNERLGIGTSTPSAIIHSVGSVTASGSIARGNFFNNALVASANNDVLVGLDINPTFTNGAFTGVENIPLRFVSQSNSNVVKNILLKNIGTGNGTGVSIGFNNINTNNLSHAFIKSYYVTPSGMAMSFGTGGGSSLTSEGTTALVLNADQTANFTARVIANSGGFQATGTTTNLLMSDNGTPVITRNGSTGIQFLKDAYWQTFSIFTNNTENLRVASTGNVLIGTTTDAGFKLDVNGTARVQGNALITQRLAVAKTTAANNTLEVQNPDASAIPNLGVNESSAIWFGSTYGLMIGKISNGNTWLQSTRVDGSATAYNILLQPRGGNVLIGTTTDAGFRLDVNGTARVSSNLTVSGTLVANLLRAANLNESMILYQRRTSTSGDGFSLFDNNVVNGSNININILNIAGSYGTSGTCVHNNLLISREINLASGTQTVRGIYYNPTLTNTTGLTTHYAIHTAVGRIRFENLPTSSAGLSAGDIWNDAGTLKIV